MSLLVFSFQFSGKRYGRFQGTANLTNLANFKMQANGDGWHSSLPCPAVTNYFKISSSLLFAEN